MEKMHLQELKNTREENPFEDPEIAKLWITSVEKETGEARDKYIYPLLKQWLQNPEMKRVLDIGAGQGVAAQFCSDKEYVGIEPSHELVKRAVEKYGQFGSFVEGEAYHLPGKDGSFDGAFSINVLFHLADLDKASKETSRVLRPGGEFLIVNPNPEAYDVWESFYEDIKRDGKKFTGRVHVPHATLPKNVFYLHSQDEIITSLTEVGLNVTQNQSFAPFKEKDLFRYYKGTKK